MAGGRLITTGANFYRRGVPNSFTGFGILTTINYTVANNKQSYFPSNSILQPFSKNRKYK